MNEGLHRSQLTLEAREKLAAKVEVQQRSLQISPYSCVLLHNRDYYYQKTSTNLKVVEIKNHKRIPRRVCGVTGARKVILLCELKIDVDRR